jgi:hypothetical protein
MWERDYSQKRAEKYGGSLILERKATQVCSGIRPAEKNIDSYEIKLPEGYIVDDLPPPVDADYSFASYHSKTEAKENVLRYTRTMEIKELSVPEDQLKSFYRVIVNRDCEAIATVELCRMHGLRSLGHKRRAPQDDSVSFVVSQRIVVVYFVETCG